MFLVISTSRNPQSRSRILADHVFRQMKEREPETEWIDLQELDLPRCDAGSCYANPKVQETAEKVGMARGIVLATPIYNFSYCSEAKNLIELTGQNWTNTLAGFVCAAGGQGSYMSIMQMANSLMLDFRTFILPRFVYATGAAFAADQITDQDLLDRLDKFADDHVKTTNLLLPFEANDSQTSDGKDG